MKTCTRTVPRFKRLLRREKELPAHIPTSRSSVSILLTLLKPIVKVKISVDGKQVFEHPRFENLDEIEVGKDAALYDMEKY